MSDIPQYLLKTGPIRLADLVARIPELATRLGDFKDLERDGEIELDGDPTAFDKLSHALEAGRAETAGNPHAIVALLQRSLGEIPGAGELRVRLSESAFKKSFRA